MKLIKTKDSYELINIKPKETWGDAILAGVLSLIAFIVWWVIIGFFS